MLAKILSSAVIGIDAYVVEVEVDISQGLPSFFTVGLPEGAVRESKDRVKAAIKNSGYPFPSDRITVNLAPADVKKEGSAFDLPMALGILAATGLLERASYQDYLFLGELALDGLLRPVKGALPTAITARSLGLKGIFLPKENAAEAAVVKGIDIYPVSFLSEVIEALRGQIQISPFSMGVSPLFHKPPAQEDFLDVKGQENAKRALEVSAAGGHNLIMVGPPGSGKTMLARRLYTILPELSFEEALETSKIYSVMGLMPKGHGLITQRPFRSPHHTISDAGLIGGGQNPKPGEVSLAQLRQPMEDGQVTISRANSRVTYPANFMLVAAMNPCPCGFLGDPKRQCRCSFLQIQRYRSKISGPLMDRIDIHIEVPPVPYKELADRSEGASSAEMLQRVMRAREVQTARFRGTPIHTNARMNTRQIKEFCKIDSRSSELLEKAMEKFGLSARAHARILKIARTIADLDQCRNIQPNHIAEAIQYRSLDRTLVL
ncbi:MAG: YifB family Mg chelatase-like AAA ATPase [Deltaproteobacteria bacterium]|nr:YifB family Mg chelatase-like AAA ATPase [Deltaproteobacteria bacterium]